MLFRWVIWIFRFWIRAKVVIEKGILFRGVICCSGALYAVQGGYMGVQGGYICCSGGLYAENNGYYHRCQSTA